MTIWDFSGKPNNLSVAQTIGYARQAGFSGLGLQTIVAIAMCESGLDANSTNDTTSGLGLDRGLVKINSYFHGPNVSPPTVAVSDACAYDPACSMKAAYKISNGNDFHEWVTYTNGCYKNNMDTVAKAIGQNPGTPAQINPNPTSSNGPCSGLDFMCYLNELRNSFITFTEEFAIFLIAIIIVALGIFLLKDETGKVKSSLVG